MKQKLFGFLKTNRQGIALISVLGVVTLATILILALFSVSDAEFKASKVYADGNQARQLADMAVNLVTSQIQSAATGEGVVKPTIWASQPGAVRVYKANGDFAIGRKLYSSNQMVITTAGLTGDSLLSKDFPSNGWDRQPSEWVNLNPTIKRVVGGTTLNYYPIIDPSAAYGVGGAEPVEGFTFSSQGADGTSLPGVNTGGPNSPGDLPMPVQWLYVLKDGTLGSVTQTPGATTATWVSAGSTLPTAENPIIGRVAFWTDDESCKININTAGEPSYYAIPTFYHERDSGWSSRPPATFEYQRFPGHPATVALSSVLNPNPTHAAGRYNGDSYPLYPEAYLSLKNAIYELTPKLGMGGSQDGTRVFDVDDFASNTTDDYNLLSQARKAAGYEHLYTSVDEWIYDKIKVNDGRRKEVSITYAGGNTLVDEQIIINSRPFLTAVSRAPEINMFGLPRIAMWPVADESLPAKFRTGYDRTIANTAVLGRTTSRLNEFTPNSYIFRRRDSQSALVDMGSSGVPSQGLQRNLELMNYLDQLMGTVMPGGASFRAKYGVKDSRQILVQIFDYIRCTNLFDAYLDELYVNENNGRPYLDDNSTVADGAKGLTPNNNNSLQMDIALWEATPAQHSYYTYTAPRFDVPRREADLVDRAPIEYRDQFNNGKGAERVTVGAYPGHGQVRPIEWQVGGQTYKGFGRFPTISEVALQFICTGDGYMGSTNNWDPGAFVINNNGQEIRSGGKTAQRVNPDIAFDEGGKRHPLLVQGKSTYWYSNFPPFPSRKTFESWGCVFGPDERDPKHPSNHPAWNPFNWNCTLDSDPVNGGIPLKADEKRVQAAIQLELFIPAVGYTKIAPDFTIVLDGSALNGMQVQDGSGAWRSLFNTTGDLVVQSTPGYWGSRLGESVGSGNTSPMGGAYGPQALMSGRQAKAIGRMPRDPNYTDGATTNIHGAMLNYPLISNPFTVKRGLNARIKFRVPQSPIKAEIYASHDWQGKTDRKNSTPVQTVMIKIPGAAGGGADEGTHSTPVPRLVVYSSDRRKYPDSAGNFIEHEAVHAVRWWAFNFNGAVGRYTGTPRAQGGGTLGVDYSGVTERAVVKDTNLDHSGTWGRFRSISRGTVQSYDDEIGFRSVPASTRIFGYSSVGTYSGVRSKEEDLVNEDSVVRRDGGMNVYRYWGSDSVRSIIPRHGDYRILAARRNVSEDIWQLHPVWQVNPEALFAHSLTGFRSDQEPGFDAGLTKTSNGQDTAIIDPNLRLVRGAWYPTSHVPDTPLTTKASDLSTVRRDFDNAPGNFRDGAYINKADDGNLSVAQFWYGKAKKYYQTRNAYFLDTFLQMPSKNAFFTPNRMVVGPGMFGSLPTGVFGGNDPTAQIDGSPWQTLLFRPDVNGHPGALAPADHHILDLFWMPVVEPYAISDSFSTAGKVNINFQMVPFSHIKRETAMHAVLKGELMTALSINDSPGRKPTQQRTLSYKNFKDASTTPKTFWSEADGYNWHRQIEINETIRHMRERQQSLASVTPSQRGLFRTSSQICDVHLIPAVKNGDEPEMRGLSNSSLKNTMNTFWTLNSLTGDNTRERPYTNLYQKTTTRSNTFRVHFLAQTIKKARSVAADQVDESKDTVSAEYRGSALLERFLDFTNRTSAEYVDYGKLPSVFSVPSLESEYRYRILEMKQFLP